MGDLDDCVTSGQKDTTGQVVQTPGSGNACAKAPGQGQRGDQWAVGAGSVRGGVVGDDRERGQCASHGEGSAVHSE